jgi:hypothetical protein
VRREYKRWDSGRTTGKIFQSGAFHHHGRMEISWG